MRVQIRPGYEPLTEGFDARVIIDVFRASTTCVAVLEGQPASLSIANDFEFLKKFSESGNLVISEVFDFGFDNSPTLVRSRGVKGRKVALKTSNLTTALENNNSGPTFIGCFNNLHAVLDRLRLNQYQAVEVVPAGHMVRRQMNFEDLHCAEVLKRSLEQRTSPVPDQRALKFRVQQISDTRIPRPRPAHYLPDLEYAIQSNISSSVPMVACQSNGLIEIGLCL